MITDLTNLFEACTELRDRLNELRKELTDDQFDDAMSGPLSEVLCAAMDVEYAIEKCE